MGERGDVFERVLTSLPVNRAAARVTGRGVHYDPIKKVTQTQYYAPPPTFRTPSHVRDLTGVSFGRHRVIGFLETSGGRAAGPKWLVRCACGTYEERRSKSIRNPQNTSDCCQQCRHLLHLKCDEIWRRTGREVAWKDL